MTTSTTTATDTAAPPRPPIDVEFLYFESCPNWKATNTALAQAATVEGATLLINYRDVSTPEEAERLGFLGSPTVLIDGTDPFSREGEPVGLACRIHIASDGTIGARSMEEFRAVLRK